MARRVAQHGKQHASWWCGRFDLLHRLECPSTRLDPTVENLPLHTLRQHPDLHRYLDDFGVPALYMLGYQAMADGPYGMVRVAALFPVDPFRGGHPQVFALDGDRRSLHRNPPWDNGQDGVSAHLCLYYPRDPDERRWTPEYGLIGLFDLARRHLACEHVWRETDKWPTEDAPHGALAKPVAPQPDLKATPLHATTATVK